MLLEIYLWFKLPDKLYIIYTVKFVYWFLYLFEGNYLINKRKLGLWLKNYSNSKRYTYLLLLSNIRIEFRGLSKYL